MDFFVKVFQESLAGLLHGFIDLNFHLCLQGIKGCLYFILRAAALINSGNAFLKINTGFNTAQYFVACPEDPVKELEFLGKQLVDALVGGIALVEEIDHHDIVLLSVPMTASNALFDALRVPGQVVVDDKGAELKVDPFGSRFRGDHHSRFIPEAVHQGGSHIGRFRSTDAVGSLMPGQPFLIYVPRFPVCVRSVEEDDLSGKLRVFQEGLQVFLCAC